MEYENIRVEVKNETAIITISREKSLNSLNRKTLEELEVALYKAHYDHGIKAILITGAGERAFVAGADINEMAEFTPQMALEFTRLGQRVLFNISKIPKVVIAAVNGYALGGGCELAMACDLIYAAKRAIFGQPEVKLGIIPGFGGTQRLSRLAGKTKAKELIFTGEMINADEALKIGLISGVFENESLMDETFKVIEKIKKNAPLAIGFAKKAIDEGFNLPLESALEIETLLFSNLFDTEDRREGISAFLSKRAPQFKGK